MKLLGYLIAGIILGVLIGYSDINVLVRSIITFKSVFGELLQFTIPLLIVFFIASSIAGLSQGSNKILGLTVFFSYVSTILAGTLALFVGLYVLPSLGLFASGDEAITAQVSTASVIPASYFGELKIPPVMSIITALVLAFVLGIGINRTQTTKLHAVIDDGRDIIAWFIKKVITPLLPLFIAGVFTEMTLKGETVLILQKYGWVLLLAILLHWLWIISLFMISASVNGISPFKAIVHMLPAYFTAIGTMSSAATIPVTLRQAKKNGADEEIADFVVPLCANIHLSGSTITLTICTMAVMLMQPELPMPTFAIMMPFIFSLGFILIAAPGVPAGAVYTSLALLISMFGFSETAIALMLALYAAQDSFGTACNVTGDGAITLLINKLKPKKNKEAEPVNTTAQSESLI